MASPQILQYQKVASDYFIPNKLCNLAAVDKFLKGYELAKSLKKNTGQHI